MILKVIQESAISVKLRLDLLWRLFYSEALLALSSFEYDTVLRVLHDMVRVYHLAHEVGSSSVVVGLLFSLLSSSLCLLGTAFCLLDSASEVGQLLEFSFDLFLPGDLALLLLLDLVLGPPPLASYLQHICTDTLRDYRRYTD